MTGDRGGGGALQIVHPAMKRRKVMSKQSVSSSCSLHGTSNALKCAWEYVFGKQGVGCKTPGQMIYTWSLLQKVVQSKMTLPGLKEMMHKTMHKLMNDAGWQTEASRFCPQAFEEYMKKISLDHGDMDADEYEAALKDAFELPTNMQNPVHTRLMTVMKAVDVFVENYVKIYFFTIAVKQWRQASKAPPTEYILTLCNTLLSLMNTRSEANNTSDQSQQREQVNNEDEVDAITLKPGDSPTFYTQLL